MEIRCKFRGHPSKKEDWDEVFKLAKSKKTPDVDLSKEENEINLTVESGGKTRKLNTKQLEGLFPDVDEIFKDYEAFESDYSETSQEIRVRLDAKRMVKLLNVLVKSTEMIENSMVEFGIPLTTTNGLCDAGVNIRVQDEDVSHKCVIMPIIK